MNLMRKAATALGGIFLAALLVAALAPKATRGIAAALVQVTNTTANPVPTVSVDDPANFPYAAFLCGGMEGFCSSDFSDSVTVPLVTTTGVPVKRLVIEDVNGQCTAFAPPSPGFAMFAVEPAPADNNLGRRSIVNYEFATQQIESPGANLFHAAVRIYADPGATITQFLVAGNAFCTFTLTGHLVTK
jgi:hypothetical protein